VISTLLSAAIAAFEIKFNLQVWLLIVIGVGIAVGFYVVFELTLGSISSTAEREREWLKRVGNPAQLEYGLSDGTAGTRSVAEAVKAIRPGNDLTFMFYVSFEGGSERTISGEAREQIYRMVVEQLKRGTLREYKRLMCFDHEVLANDHELKSGVLRVGEGPGTITRQMGEHCRLMMATNKCSLYVAPVVLRHAVGFFGTDRVTMSIETVDQETGVRTFAGILHFSDPPNGEIIEQFRQIERMTERRMVAVHKIVFPEDAALPPQVSGR